MKKLLIILMILLVTACSKPEPQPNQLRFAKVNNIPLVEVEINGKRGRLLIDTGASQSLIDLTSADKYNFTTYKLDEHFHGIGGSTHIYDVRNIKVTYRDSLIRIPFKAADIKHLRTNYGIIGILGSDWLKRNNATVNYKTNLVTIEP